ncbi:MAG TPA: toprim domain-containing protein [Mesorhizobium sp.]|jgi:hypothetical protein|nr:toprim domain-containing protein [Mesorhizobium sp.]
MTGLAHLAARLGGTVVGKTRIVAPGPGHSANDRSLSVLFDPQAPDGFTVYSFAGDDWRACRDHVRERLGLEGRGQQGKGWLPNEARSRHAVAPANTTSNNEFASRLWREAAPVGGTLVELYLRARGIDMPEEVLSGEALRFHPACPFRLDGGELVRLPAMLAAMVEIATDQFSGVHRTALAPDGSAKADVPGLGTPKKMLGSSRSACVKLSSDEDVSTGLHVAEGIETALACMAMGFRPMWAMLSAGAISTLPTLPGIEALTIFADHDENVTGLAAARACARRWAAAGAEVAIRTPPQPDSDWADRGDAS